VFCEIGGFVNCLSAPRAPAGRKPRTDQPPAQVGRQALRVSYRMAPVVELLVLIVVVVVVLLVLMRGGRYLGQLIVNGIIGVTLLFLTNLVLADDIPINVLTVLICAIGGVIGWIIILVLHLLGVAFHVPA
jgi:hypothetical protein